jgi:hypothetical protein
MYNISANPQLFAIKIYVAGIRGMDKRDIPSSDDGAYAEISRSPDPAPKIDPAPTQHIQKPTKKPTRTIWLLLQALAVFLLISGMWYIFQDFEQKNQFVGI